ncbi:hypothetical protein D3C76_901730 [compost metagenome]
MHPLADFIVFQVVKNQFVGFHQFAAQAGADQQAGIATHVVVFIDYLQMQGADVGQVLLAERAVEQVQVQHAISVGGQLMVHLAGLDRYRPLAPGHTGVFLALVLLHFGDARQVLLGTAVGLGVHERVEAVEAIAQPVVGNAVGQVAQGKDVDHVGADTGHHRDRAQRNLIDFAPGLVRRVAIITTGDFKLGDFEVLLFVDAHTPLRQLEYLGVPGIDLQAVFEQLALDAFLMFAAL